MAQSRGKKNTHLNRHFISRAPRGYTDPRNVRLWQPPASLSVHEWELVFVPVCAWLPACLCVCCVCVCVYRWEVTEFAPSGMFTIWVKELVPGAEQPWRQTHTCTHTCTRSNTHTAALVRTLHWLPFIVEGITLALTRTLEMTLWTRVWSQWGPLVLKRSVCIGKIPERKHKHI